MKIVLRHKATGRYYCARGCWVRRADNALAFDDVRAARQFSRKNHLVQVQPVQRLAPYVAALLRHALERPALSLNARTTLWLTSRPMRFSEN